MGWITEKEQNYFPLLEYGTFHSNGSPTNPTDSNYLKSCRTVGFLDAPRGDYEIAALSGLTCKIYFYDSNETFVSIISTIWSTDVYKFSLSASGKLRIAFTSSDSLSPDFAVTVHGKFVHWQQDDSEFFGYPFIADAGIADKFDGMNSIWKLQPDVFFHYPFIKKTGTAAEFDGTNSIWAMGQGQFFDYPFIRKAGIAHRYGNEGFSRLYIGSEKVQKLYYGNMEVRRCYYGDTLVFESG